MTVDTRERRGVCVSRVLGRGISGVKWHGRAQRQQERAYYKLAIDLSMEVSNLREAATFSESRCEARLRSLREELEGQQETRKS